MGTREELARTIEALTVEGKGILAADESTPTCTKRFQAVGIESTETTRRDYRELLLGTPGIGEFIAGVILYEETLYQQGADGTPMPQLAARNGVLPGIKVDKGLAELPNAGGDTITQGLDGLAERLAKYKEQGARFAKWREVYRIGPHNPTPLGIRANAEVLARYAAQCQVLGIVPIVEPEVLIDGEHDMARCFEVTDAVQHAVFHALHRHRVDLEAMVLKPSMVIPGKGNPAKAAPEEVARETLRVLRRNVPAAVPTINFLSGGQTPEQATANLDAMNRAAGPKPWRLSYSYARALQEPVMALWKGKAEQVQAAQQAFLLRARLNSAAARGQYRPDMERAA